MIELQIENKMGSFIAAKSITIEM